MPLEHTVIHSHMPSHKSYVFEALEIAVPMQSGSRHSQECLDPHVLPRPPKEEDTKLRGASHDPCWGSYGPALGSGRGASLRSQTLGVSLAVQRQQMLRSTRTRAGSRHNSPAASPAPSTQGRGGHRAHQHTQCTLLPKAGPGAAHSPPCSRVH